MARRPTKYRGRMVAVDASAGIRIRRRRIPFVNMAPKLDLGDVARPVPCARRTWCVLVAEHDGACVELPRAKARR